MRIPKTKNIVVFFNIPRLIFHCLFFTIFKKRCLADVLVALRHRGYESRSVMWGFLYLLVFDDFYRNIFYYRIGKWKYLIKFFCPPHKSFIVGTHSKIGEGFLAVHSFATIINAKSIGRNFAVMNGVTIGNNRGGVPEIGDNVTINVNAVVVGPIIIGDNVVVGAGTVLTKSVPSNSVVVGNPAYILKQDGAFVRQPL